MGCSGSPSERERSSAAPRPATSPMQRPAAAASVDRFAAPMPTVSSAAERSAGAAPTMRWWGWGDPSHPPLLSARALDGLRERLGATGPPQPPVALEQVRLEGSALSESAVDELRRLLGADRVSLEREARVRHAAGRGYLDLVRLRSGELEGAPDAVLNVSDGRQIPALLDLCAKRSIAVVPFGGGTSVVGGLAPLRGRHDAVIALDLAGLAGIESLDRRSLTVTAGAGMRVAALEAALAAQGLTLGHFPQSFEHVSLGGCAATRSAGQASTGYGRFEDLVLGLRLLTPGGEIELPAVPASAAGPDLRQLIVGSEGVLGVIDRLTLRLAPRPAARHYGGLLFADFEAGAQTLRELAQDGVAPAVARLSDRPETQLTFELARPESPHPKQSAARLYLAARGRREGCLAILGFEGVEAQRVRAAHRHALRIARRHGAISLGRSPGAAWLGSRFAAPYMRDELLTHGVMVETLETATSWANLTALKSSIERAIDAALTWCGTPPIVGCHVSHLYETGASLYFTFLARALLGEEQRQWQAVKDAASEAIVKGGGTITHHHAIGRDHAAYLEREIGAGGVAALAALKAQLDPEGIMNPGKLLPALGA
jgi:alkyldihydroxyacetonephosphate synthase